MAWKMQQKKHNLTLFKHISRFQKENLSDSFKQHSTYFIAARSWLVRTNQNHQHYHDHHQHPHSYQNHFDPGPGPGWWGQIKIVLM